MDLFSVPVCHFLPSLSTPPGSLTMWDLSPVCTENDLPQTSHMKGFSPVCVLMWSLSLAGRVNCLVHKSHLYGLSPLCVYLCFTKSNDWIQAKSHWSHLKGFSPKTKRRHKLISSSLKTMVKITTILAQEVARKAMADSGWGQGARPPFSKRIRSVMYNKVAC